MTSHAASYEALSDFSFANLAQAHALQVLVPDSCTKITAAFRILFVAPLRYCLRWAPAMPQTKWGLP